MATNRQSAPVDSSEEPVSAANGRVVEYEQYIENQLRTTRSHVRSVDLGGSFMLLIAATLAYFFLAAIADHWIIPGGLGFWGRLSFLSVYVAGAVYFLIAQVLPLCVRRINPVYAAYTIERSRPSLKNALVNFLLFRENPAGMNNAVYEAIEEQAATNLAKVRVEAAVDRSKLIHIGYLLLAILFVCAIYTLLSPKNLLQTVGRVAMPWADINAPTRTTIAEIEPGDSQAFRGQQVTVKARVEGQTSEGRVVLYYTTDDGQVVDRPVEMNLPVDGYKHACVLPSGDSALQQSLTYRIEAGDAKTRPFRLEVVAAPTIVVSEIRYKYPPYTGLVDHRVERQGDIKAIEGTMVTVVAVANQDIQSATIDFDCDNKHDQRMQVDRQQAEATFRLALQDDRRTPEHGSYQLLFKNEDGRQNPQPVRHEIEVTRDVPPEIQFVAPRQDEMDLPLNAVAQLEIVAEDPDFALRSVKFSATSGTVPLVDQWLLNEVRRGQFVEKFRFEPRKLGLKAGAVVEHWAVAEDTKDPKANRTETPRRRIRIVSPSQQPRDRDQVARNDGQDEGQQQPGAGRNRPGPGDQARDNDEQKGQEKKPDEQDPSQADKPGEGQPGKDGQGEAHQSQNEKGKPGEGDGGKENANADGQSSSATEGNENKDENQKPSGAKAGQKQSSEKGSSFAKQQSADQGVPSDGSDDGDAFERILKHRDDQKKSPDKSSESRKPGAAEKQDPHDRQPTDQDQQDQDNTGKNSQDTPDKSGAKGGERQDQKPPSGDRQQKGEKSNEAPDKDRAQQGDPAEKSDRDPSEKPPGDEADQRQQANKPDAGSPKRGEQAPQPRPKSSPEKNDPSQGNQGAGSGDQGAGDGQQGKSEQQGQAGQPGKGKQPSKEKSRGGKSGDRGQAASPDQAKDAADGDESTAKDAAPQGKGRPTGKNKPGERPADAQDTQDTDSGEGHAGKTPPKPNSADAPRGEKQDGESSNSGGLKSADNATKDQKPAGAADKAAERDGNSSESRDNQSPESNAKANSKSGQGASSNGDPTRPRADQKPPGDRQRPDARGGDGQQDKGQSGAGQAGDDKQGSPSPTEETQPREKTPGNTPDEKDAKKDDGAQSPSHSKRESDSQGADDGDRSGGGKRGGGQKANKSGTGGAGQNTPSDEGAGASDEAGAGENSDRAGNDRATDKQTGSGGSQLGKGSSKNSSSGDGGKPDEGSSSGSTAADSPTGGAAGSKNRGDQPGTAASNPTQGGKSTESKDQKWQPTPDEAEAANLDYTRKATDLALDHLKDQLRRGEPDPKLLDRLGWTRGDLENFVRRWEQMRQQAQAPGEQGAAAREQLNDTLRSLGLRPRATSIKSNATRDDQSRGLKESRRSSPPPEYIEQFKAYTQGTARGGE